MKSQESWKVKALCLGNFDGIHRGHQELMSRCLGLGGDSGALLTFSPHPSQILQPPGVLEILTLAERVEKIEDMGFAQVFVQQFD